MELLEKLGELQSQYGFLPKNELESLSAESGLPLGEIVSRASFYSFLTFEPDPADHIERIYPCRKADRLLSPALPYEWKALKKALLSPRDIIPAVEQACLLGRSGGGFPVARKWEVTKAAPGNEKYIVCNADEGELFTGKDRVLLENNPWAVIEGMAICAIAAGAKKGFIYLRAEYADLRDNLEGILKDAPLNDFEIEIYLGHGAYVCGDETALLNSLEGRRGETRLKPPYPGVSGYRGCPTVVNNVESFANVALILNTGAEEFKSSGTPDYPGTKLFTVCGAVNRPGVYEFPAGTLIGDLLKAAGGASEPIQALQMGGGSCRIVRTDCADVSAAPKSCSENGLNFGTGSLRFIGTDENLLTYVRELTEFFARESCGTCTPCRVGLHKLSELLKKAEEGTAWPEDIAQISELAEQIRTSSRCPLGQAAVTPVLSLAENFPEVLACR